MCIVKFNLEVLVFIKITLKNTKTIYLKDQKCITLNHFAINTRIYKAKSSNCKKNVMKQVTHIMWHQKYE